MANPRQISLGKNGVDLVTSPIHLPDGSWTQLQNAEFSSNRSQGGIKKRGGLAALNSVALAGTVLSAQSVPLRSPVDLAGNFFTPDDPNNPDPNNPEGGPLLTIPGGGNPQGVLPAPLGSMYIDTNTGLQYRKLGGAGTAYGWYPDIPMGAGRAYYPRAFALDLGLDTSTISGASTGTLFGGLTAGWTANSANNQLRNYIANQTVYGSFDTGNVATNVSYFNTTTAQFRWWETDFDVVFRIRTPATITLVRMWFGLSTAVITDTDTLASGGNGAICFRYSTVVPDPGWVGYMSDASGNAATALVAAIAGSTSYKLRIRCVRSGATPTVYFSVDDGTEIAATSHLPATGVNSFFVLGGSTQTGAARTFMWNSINGTVGQT